MGPEQAAAVLVTVKNEQLLREGKPALPPQAIEMIRKPIVEAAVKEGGAFHSTANLWDDGIVDPAQTRDVLGLALSVVSAVDPANRDRGHGTFRM
jgi:acetyl-CoA carboxylase carboxyltransferase component